MADNPKKPSLADEVRTQIAAIAAAATDEDRKNVAAIIARAKVGEIDGGVLTYTSGMCAIFFMDHNPHNRDWRPAKTMELCREIKKGDWRWNNCSFGFYKTGNGCDGQHRWGAIALAGVTLKILTGFGVDEKAIVTVDTGTKRTAADAMKLAGVSDSPIKQTLVKTRATYLVKAGDSSAALRSETEVMEEAILHSDLLDKAIEIGRISRQGIVDPIFKETQAAEVAYLAIRARWPEQRIREKLALFQSGQSKAGDAEPFFVVNSVVRKSRDSGKSREALKRLAELGVVIYAMVETERGVTAMTASKVKAAVKGALPAPDFPEQAMSEAAE